MCRDLRGYDGWLSDPEGGCDPVALDNLGVERENYDQVVMVGDRNNDIYGAKENGIQVIGVLYGYGDLAELQSAGADYIAKMPEEIAQIIGRCNHERV